MLLNIFSCTSLPSVCLLWWRVCSNLFHIFLGLFVYYWSFESSLSILDIRTFSAGWFTNTLSRSVACLFILFTVSLRNRDFKFYSCIIYQIIILWVMLLIFISKKFFLTYWFFKESSFFSPGEVSGDSRQSEDIFASHKWKGTTSF